MEWLFNAYLLRRLLRSLKNVIYLVLVLAILLLVAAWVFAPDLLSEFIRSVMGRFM